MGKESRWIDSFRILTPNSHAPIDVSEESNPELFHAVIGGHGYIGFVTDITYKLTPIDKDWLDKENDIYRELCAHTTVTTHGSIGELIQKQLQLIKSAPSYPRGVSAEWFGGSAANPDRIHGAVCDSSFTKPSVPKRCGFPLYHKLHSRSRYWAEVAVRYRSWNAVVDWILYLWAAIFRKFEDPLDDFLFFMDGDTAARARFEKRHRPKLFPLVQQTFVVPIDKTETFTKNCIRKISERGLYPTESDMLYALEDECLLSANYRLSGFAVSFAFEHKADFCDPRVFELLRELSRDCLTAGGRIHLPKNSHVDREVFRLMFKGQIEEFENIKRQYDPDLLLRNPFSDRFFEFRQSHAV
jgi:decaprenylphospho-beta-D-ribofuranose 2-oxidase